MLRSFGVALSAMLTIAAPVAAFANARVAIAGGTPATIRIVDKIDSGTANVGDTFEFKSEDNVVVNGWVVIARGAEGRGQVSSVERAGSHGHPGNLGLKFDYIYAVDGEKIRLSSINKKDAGDSNKGASSTATIASTLLLGPVGLFAHNWVKGKNITVDSSRTFSAFVDDTVHIVATQRAAVAGNPANDGFAH